MALTIKHARVSTKPPGPNPDHIQAVDWNADHQITGITGLLPVGTVLDFCGITVPAGYLECYGQVLNAAAYLELFAALVKSATVTITIANPAVVSWSGHGLKVGDDVGFISSGTLPTGILSADIQKYRVISAGYSANAFRFSLTWEGAPIITTAAGSGTITGIHAPFGVSTGLSQFAVPDYRARVLAGITNMGGSQSSLMASGYSMGSDVGTEKVVLTVPELPPHDHSIPVTAVSRSDNQPLGSTVRTVAYNTAGNTGLKGDGVGHANMQPTEFLRKIIFAGV